MEHALAKGESAVQDAIVSALAEYCYAEKLRFRHTLPYSNQQGFDPKKVCADIAAVLANAKILILEIKAASKVLPLPTLASFNEDQWKECKQFEVLHVPLHYAFNTVANLAHAGPAPFSPFMCVQTLTEIGLAKPSDVTKEGNVEKVVCNLFQYLRSSQPNLNGAGGKVGKETAALEVLRLLENPLSNSALVLAFAADASVLTLTAPQLQQLHLHMLEVKQEIDKQKFPAIAQYMALVEESRERKKAKKSADLKALEQLVKKLSHSPQKLAIDPAIFVKEDLKDARKGQGTKAAEENELAIGQGPTRPKNRG